MRLPDEIEMLWSFGLTQAESFLLFRRKHGIKQRVVALGAGTSQPTLSRWERGRIELDEFLVSALWLSLMREIAISKGEIEDQEQEEAVA